MRLLADEDADSGAIIDGLTWLKGQVNQGDIGVVYLSGHGVTDPRGDYFYVPYNAEIENIGGVLLPTHRTAVPNTEISQTLKQLAGNALFFFDTCHAGKAAGLPFRDAPDYYKFINETASSANAVVLASSGSSELSQESESGNMARLQGLTRGFGGEGFPLQARHRDH